MISPKNDIMKTEHLKALKFLLGMCVVVFLCACSPVIDTQGEAAVHTLAQVTTKQDTYEVQNEIFLTSLEVETVLCGMEVVEQCTGVFDFDKNISCVYFAKSDKAALPEEACGCVEIYDSARQAENRAEMQDDEKNSAVLAVGNFVVVVTEKASQQENNTLAQEIAKALSEFGGNYFVSDDDIIIMPKGSMDFCADSVGNALEQLKNIGFDNIELSATRLNVNPALNKIVCDISIDEKTDFAAGDKFDKASKVVVTYIEVIKEDVEAVPEYAGQQDKGEESVEKTSEVSVVQSDVSDIHTAADAAIVSSQKISSAVSPQAVQEFVWVPTNGGKKYHKTQNCSSMKNPAKMTISDAQVSGFTPCKRCF